MKQLEPEAEVVVLVLAVLLVLVLGVLVLLLLLAVDDTVELLLPSDCLLSVQVLFSRYCVTPGAGYVLSGVKSFRLV